MDEAQWGSVTIVGAAILGLVLLWLVLRTRSRKNTPTNQRAEQATHHLYEEEEQRRRDGTDGL